MSKVKLPEIYFDSITGGYWMELNPGRYTALSASDAKAHLQMGGVNTQIKSEEGLSYGDEILAKAQIKNYVHYAAPLAGYKAGVHTMYDGKKVLITESCQPVAPGRSKKIPHHEKFFSELIGAQHVHLLAWMKVGYESILRGDFMPGQLLILAGPTGCGKTFVQWIITQLFGGRDAQPFDYMAGKTNFNADLAKAPHLAMGDEESSFDIRARLRFAAQIKRLCVEPVFRIHGKGKEALTLETFRRLSMCVNDQPEKLMVIPPLDGDIIDKITLLKCNRAVSALSSDRKENQANFRAELPALAAFLIDWEIPKAMRDQRFGVKSYQHPELVEILNGSSPEMQLLTLIDEWVFRPRSDADEDFWRGSSEELKHELMSSKYRDTAATILSKWAGATGSYLARLKQKFPARIEQSTSKGLTRWLIRPPTADKQER